jgi:glycosyltransferase involved in cell wall biosynthesis
MHSVKEGFGLVLLESMINKTPWISRNIAGANLMKDYGLTYETDEQLVSLLQNFDEKYFNVDLNYNYVESNHMIQHTVDDIESCVLKSKTQ